MNLTRESFFQRAEVPTETISLPQLGGSVLVRGMTAKERSAFEDQFTLKSGKPNAKARLEMRERLLIATVCDMEGQPLFTREDVAAIGRLPAATVEPLVDSAQRVCGMTATQDLGKNSDDDQTD